MSPKRTNMNKFDRKIAAQIESDLEHMSLWQLIDNLDIDAEYVIGFYLQEQEESMRRALHILFKHFDLIKQRAKEKGIIPYDGILEFEDPDQGVSNNEYTR